MCVYINTLTVYSNSILVTEDDTKREILSGRFEIYVTGMSKYAAKDVSLLKYLNLLEDFFAGKFHAASANAPTS
jgi:hypothetical protein